MTGEGVTIGVLYVLGALSAFMISQEEHNPMPWPPALFLCFVAWVPLVAVLAVVGFYSRRRKLRSLIPSFMLDEVGREARLLDRLEARERNVNSLLQLRKKRIELQRKLEQMDDGQYIPKLK